MVEKNWKKKFISCRQIKYHAYLVNEKRKRVMQEDLKILFTLIQNTFISLDFQN